MGSSVTPGGRTNYGAAPQRCKAWLHDVAVIGLSEPADSLQGAIAALLIETLYVPPSGAGELDVPAQNPSSSSTSSSV
jgi:hypothetical protein